MIRFGRASRRMDLIGLALLAMMMVVLWVQRSAVAAEAAAQGAPDAVGVVLDGEEATTVAPDGAERI